MKASINFAIQGLLSAACCSAAPLKGSELTPRTDGVKPLNEPCYVHDGACDGYAVCCVTIDTCISKHSGTVSSNTAYYEGGCQSFSSSKKDYSKSPGCTQQGECLVQHLEVCKGGIAKPGFMTDVPADVLNRLMMGSCETDCPKANYGHRSYGSDSKLTVITTTTTTTTVITRVTKTMNLAISDVTKVKSDKVDEMTLMVKKTIAAMAGFATDHSMVTLEMGTPAAKMAVTYHLDVSSSHKLTAEKVQSNIAAATNARINAMLAMRIGSCSYTVTVHESSGSSAASTTARPSTSSAQSVPVAVLPLMAVAAVALLA